MLGHGPIDGAPIGASGDATPDLTIPDDKLTQYLLNVDHPEGGAKAEFFLAHGFSLAFKEPFLFALFDHGKPDQLVSAVTTEFGVKFVYEGPMMMPDGSTWQVRSVWHRASGDVRRILVTAYPF